MLDYCDLGTAGAQTPAATATMLHTVVVSAKMQQMTVCNRLDFRSTALLHT